MIQKTFSVTTKEVNKEQIWKLMSNVNQWKNWDTSVEKSELKGNFETGSHFLFKPKGGPDINIKLIEVIPYAYFKDETVFPLAKMNGEHWYEETADGLKITITMTMRGVLSFLWNKIVMKGIVAQLESDILLQIKNAAKN
ncbi:SRPBCC family protein [Pedobacter fastidiosus]|uniref:Polyketide cyclase n=1 Tax=Pedobacter fastidiosus TaxID=2765361 RepID=A0ABR7KPI6_9SPHI|nr:SRPBCC family protein [Pedobacter fastidiosus]MBC6109990.1 polyketide cyclase [Pedobacter fastidiosus]